MRMIRDYYSRSIEREMSDCFFNLYETPENERRFMIVFYMYSFMGVVGDYLEGGMEEEPIFVAARCNAIVRCPLR